MKAPVQVALDSLWAGIVDEYRCDLLNHRVIFQGRIIEGGQEKGFLLTFSGVPAYYYVFDDSPFRRRAAERAPDSYIELTALHYDKDGTGHFGLITTPPEWGPHGFRSHPNFVLEIWDHWLFIEANRVRINEMEFEVGYPEGE